jgi:hypothetical protein
MLVHIARIGDRPVTDLSVGDFELLAAVDRFRQHELTPDPAAADVILFTQCHAVDWRLRAIREHPLAKRYWAKVMVYDQRDRPWRSFPGIYVSSPRRAFDPGQQRAWSYPGTPHGPSSSNDPDLLFSFVGSATAPCRMPLLGLRHPDAIIEVVRDFMFWDTQAPRFEDHRIRFQEVLRRSRFVLCPRGRGTSSIRLYEALAAGRVPVIISDDWVEPAGPNWDAFSLRWPEGRTEGLVELLEDRAPGWRRMSEAASQAHQEYFAPEVSFHRIVDLCGELRASGLAPASPRRLRGRSVTTALHERLGGGSSKRWLRT